MYSTLRAVQYSTVQYSTVQYSTVHCEQYSTVQYSTVQYVPVSHEHVPGISLSFQCIPNQSFSILKNIVKEKKKRLGRKRMEGRGGGEMIDD